MYWNARFDFSAIQLLGLKYTGLQTRVDTDPWFLRPVKLDDQATCPCDVFGTPRFWRLTVVLPSFSHVRPRASQADPTVGEDALGLIVRLALASRPFLRIHLRPNRQIIGLNHLELYVALTRSVATWMGMAVTSLCSIWCGLNGCSTKTKI